MKIKNISFIALSLLVSLSALRAVPVDPNAPSEPQQVILKNVDSGKPVTVQTSQTFFAITLTSDLSEDSFTFTDSCLLNTRKLPYSFGINGQTQEGTEAASLALTSSDPIFLEDSSESFSHFSPDGTVDADGNPNYEFVLSRTTTFLFFMSRGGNTTLNFTNGTHTYTYKITVVDDLPPAPAR